MDLLSLAGIVIFFGFLLMAMGLSYLSQGLSAMEYNNQWGTQVPADYYKNPLFKLNSKYWHYRPKGAVVLTKAKWEEIEKNIGLKINKSLSTGVKLGRKEMLEEIECDIKAQQKKNTPSSPYLTLGVEAKADMATITERYQYLIKIYDPLSARFDDLDEAFIELAEIRTKQIKKAYQMITTGVGGGIDGG